MSGSSPQVARLTKGGGVSKGCEALVLHMHTAQPQEPRTGRSDHLIGGIPLSSVRWLGLPLLTPTYLRKCYANARECHFPHVQEIQITSTGASGRLRAAHPSPPRPAAPRGAGGGAEAGRTEAALRPGAAEAAGGPGPAEGGCSASSCPTQPAAPPPRRPAAPSASASAARRRVRARLPRPGPGAPRPPPARPARRTRGEERPGPFRGRRATHGPPLRGGARRFAAMTSLLSTAPPGEDPMTTPILQATEALSPEAEASTALIAVVITVVFLTLLSVVILIFFYLYKNKGSYVTYEPAEGEPSAILQMESDSAKGRDKEEYFI
ncbi:small cell adhesion glycoprotein [Canis lupus dingo]|nr:small cell adhesion glycoprotein [Canis lupus dingo]